MVHLTATKIEPVVLPIMEKKIIINESSLIHMHKYTYVYSDLVYMY